MSLHSDSPRIRVAVLGGGIPGLAAAHALQRWGYDPVVFDTHRSTDAAIHHDGLAFDASNQPLTPESRHLDHLLGELGLRGSVHWAKAGFSCWHGGRQRKLSAGPGWLHTSGMLLPSRMRAAMATWLLARRTDSGHLENVPAEPFLRAQFGDNTFCRLWRPLLQAEFGDLYSRIPMEWVRARLREGWLGESAPRGFLRGGAASIVEALTHVITMRGGIVRNGTALQWVLNEPHGVCLNVDGRTERYAAAVSTLSPPQLRALAAGPLQEQVPLPHLVCQGRVDVLVIARKPFQRTYWNAVDDPRLPFHVMTEPTLLQPHAWTHGRSVLHLTRYCRPGSDLYHKEDYAIAQTAVNGLQELLPAFDRHQIESCHVLREECAQPVWPLGGLPRDIPARVGTTNVFLSADVQSYPRTHSWDAAIAQAHETAQLVARHLATTPVRELTAAY